MDWCSLVVWLCSVDSQVEVLAHPRVSLFLSHCGLSSAFEAVALRIPMLCLPVLLSQVILGAHMMRVGAMVAQVDHLSPTLEADLTVGVQYVARAVALITACPLTVAAL